MRNGTLARRTLLLTAAACLLFTRATAQQPDAEAKPAADLTPTYTSVQRLPEAVTLATLSNGLTVIVQENHVAPVATVRCYVKNTGSAYEGRYLGAGLSHVLEHVVAGGTTTKRSEKEIEKFIDRFGGATNAYTTTHLTAFYIDCPAKDTMTAIDLVADSMQHIKFEPAEFERELRVVRRELADGEVDRRRVLWKMLGETIYTENPVRYPTIGYLEVLNQTTNQTIIDFYRQRYVPNNQVFVVVGDVDAKKVLDQVARQWAGTPRGYETYVPLTEEPKQLAPREAVREMDGATYDLVLAWPTVTLSDPALYALDVAAYILGEGDSSRLVRRLKYDQQVALSVDASSYTPSFVNGWFGIFVTAQPDKWQQANDEALREIKRLCEELVSPEELAKAKNQKAAELVFENQTVQDAAESLGRNYLSAGDPLFDNTYAANIQKVTAEQVRAVARRYLVPQRLNRIVIAPPGGAPKRAASEAGGAESPIRLAQLDNGVRVLLKRHTHRPMVNIQAYLLGATLVDSEKTAGRSDLVGQMLDKGTAKMNAQQIAEYFDSIGGQFSTTAGRNTIYASATVLRDDYSRALEVLSDCFVRPTFPTDEFEKVKNLALGAIARRADNPQSETFELFYDSLPKDSPYHIIQGGKADTVSRMTAEQMRAYHARYFTPDKIVVTVFGDVDPDEALAKVKAGFGGLGAGHPEPIDFDRPNAIPESIVRHKQTAKQTGMVLMGYPAASIFQKEDYAALTVLDAITSGYSYPGGWLHNELRGEGLVYYVHAFQMTGPAPGCFAVMAQTQPDKVDEVVRRIQANLEKARQGQIPEEEFQRAIEMVVSLHAQDNTTVAAQAQQAALDEMYGLGFDYDKSFDARIQAVTRDDVIRVARKYLQKYVLVTTSPEPAKAE